MLLRGELPHRCYQFKKKKGRSQFQLNSLKDTATHQPCDTPHQLHYRHLQDQALCSSSFTFIPFCLHSPHFTSAPTSLTTSLWLAYQLEGSLLSTCLFYIHYISVFQTTSTHLISEEPVCGCLLSICQFLCSSCYHVYLQLKAFWQPTIICHRLPFPSKFAVIILSNSRRRQIYCCW